MKKAHLKITIASSNWTAPSEGHKNKTAGGSIRRNTDYVLFLKKKKQIGLETFHVCFWIHSDYIFENSEKKIESNNTKKDLDWCQNNRKYLQAQIEKSPIIQASDVLIIFSWVIFFLGILESLEKKITEK